MNVNKAFQQFSFTIGICILMVISCNYSSPDIAGISTQTGNGKTIAIIGKLYGPDGHTPAPDARVTIHRLESSIEVKSDAALKKSLSGPETVITDAKGNFIFDSVQSRNTYMIEANQGETLFALIEHVTINDNDSLVNVEDTLKAPGSIKAIVCFNYPDIRIEKASFMLNAYYKSQSDDPRSSSTWFSKGYDNEWIDSAHNCNGVLIIDNLAEGIYTFSADIRYPSEYKGKNIYLKKPGIVIKSGQITDLDTLRFPEMDIPDVAQHWTNYDSTTGVIKIHWRWNASDTGKVSGINIYQQMPPYKFPLKVNSVPITDTVFVDTGFWDYPRRPKISDGWWDPASGSFDSYSHDRYTIPVQSLYIDYILVSVDKKGNESWKLIQFSPGIWWKKENGIPFSQDTLSVTWPDNLISK